VQGLRPDLPRSDLSSGFFLYGLSEDGGLDDVEDSLNFRWRFPALIERIYAAVTIYAGGIWLSPATAVGPSAPLPREALVIGAFILSVPWWAHRRRRAKVTLERKLQAWPDIAKTIGLILQRHFVTLRFGGPGHSAATA
jgi:hypothetical protein